MARHSHGRYTTTQDPHAAETTQAAGRKAAFSPEREESGIVVSTKMQKTIVVRRGNAQAPPEIQAHPEAAHASSTRMTSQNTARTSVTSSASAKPVRCLS